MAKNGERRFIAGDGSLADAICRYPAGTQAPAGIWPSDLCMQNSTIMHAIHAVHLPDVPTFGNGYVFDREDLVRRHIDTFDDPDAIKHGGMYLTANRKWPIGSGLSIFSDQAPRLVTLIHIRDDSDEVLVPASCVRSIVDDQILIEVPPNVTIDEAYTVEVLSERSRGTSRA